MNKTIQIVYVFVLLIGTLITTNMADKTPPNGVQARYIFQPPNATDVSQISGTSTPWVIPELIPDIEEFKKNVFEDLMNSTTVQNFWDIKTDSTETRAIFFKLVNKFLYDIGHPVPAALANIISKTGSLFDPLEMPVFFEADAIHLAEFFLSRDVKITRDTATRYVDAISKALESADSRKKESVWQALLDGYSNFVTSYGIKSVDCIEELLELNASQFIILHDK